MKASGELVNHKKGHGTQQIPEMTRACPKQQNGLVGGPQLFYGSLNFVIQTDGFEI